MNFTDRGTCRQHGIYFGLCAVCADAQDRAQAMEPDSALDEVKRAYLQWRDAEEPTSADAGADGVYRAMPNLLTALRAAEALLSRQGMRTAADAFGVLQIFNDAMKALREMKP